MNKNPNQLINESSPYLLQHAYNPVNWLPFSEQAFEKAKKENKLVLISIGYSACHWCHVMEHESFEDDYIAGLMNKHFVNIKVDREERTDVDNLYMQAVQLMTGHGGWPLNCFTLPDGRPVYGGTYFNKKQWENVLINLSELQLNDPAKVLQYAQNLTEGINQSELLTTQRKSESALSQNLLTASVEKWEKMFDDEYGGTDRAPKFPLPNNYLFLLRYSLLKKDDKISNHVHLTLRQMAHGGIYDQLHGGFARYSTDIYWKVPHFEKMLYDNAQLVSLYTEAYQHTKNTLYKQTVLQTLDFIESEWFKSEGYFYSAYDADSEGEEGKFYVWQKEELFSALGERFNFFADYYHIDDVGYWEHDNYILMRNHNLAELLVKHNLSSLQAEEIIKSCLEKLKVLSQKRVKPGLDDKTLTSWNAMMCSAFAKAYLVFENEKYKTIAIQSMDFILSKLTQPNGKLYRTFKNNHAKINGFLDDYAFVIEALINTYLISQEEKYLVKADNLTQLVLNIFNNPESPFLYYTDKDSSGLVARTTEISDNVIPSSNSQMALNLHYLGVMLNKNSYSEKAAKMLNSVLDDLVHYGPGYSNWGCLALFLTYPAKEIAIVGKTVNELLKELHKHSFTNTILAVSRESSALPLLENRFVEGKTLFYVCQNYACQLPVQSAEEALKQLD